MQTEQVKTKKEGSIPPYSCNPLHHLDAPQQAGPPLPHVAVVVEVIFAGQEVELHHAEHPIAVLDKHTKPGEILGKKVLDRVFGLSFYCSFHLIYSS